MQVGPVMAQGGQGVVSEGFLVREQNRPVAIKVRDARRLLLLKRFFVRPCSLLPSPPTHLPSSCTRRRCLSPRTRFCERFRLVALVFGGCCCCCSCFFEERALFVLFLQIGNLLDSPFVLHFLGTTRHATNDALGLVMPLMEGGPLSRRLWVSSVRDRPPVEQRLLWAWEAAMGLEVLHAAHILHRDVKSSNLLLGDASLSLSLSRLFWCVNPSVVLVRRAE